MKKIPFLKLILPYAEYLPSDKGSPQGVLVLYGHLLVAGSRGK
jgi:hypothetical protein